MVHVEQGTHDFTDSNYPNFPGTLSLIVNGQTVQSEQVDDSGDYSLTYIPSTGASGSIEVQAQVTDSVLYSGTDTQTINIKTTSSFFRSPTISGGNGKKGTLTGAKRR